MPADGPMDWLRDLPAALRFVRAARRLDVREAGKQAGVSGSTISRIENGAGADFNSLLSVGNWIAWAERPEVERATVAEED